MLFPPTSDARTPTDKSSESTAGKLAVANNRMEEFGPIPIDVVFEPFSCERKGDWQ